MNKMIQGSFSLAEGDGLAMELGQVGRYVDCDVVTVLVVQQQDEAVWCVQFGHYGLR